MMSGKECTEKLNVALRGETEFFRLPREVRDYMDILIVRDNLPMAYEARTQESRFVRLQRARHQFEFNKCTKV